MKLSKILNVFKKDNLASDKTKLKQDFNILREYLAELFPTKETLGFDNELINYFQGINNEFVVEAKYDEKFSKNKSTNLLPFHTRDNQWLTEFFFDIVKTQIKWEKKFYKNRSAYCPSFSSVKAFVETDPSFALARNSFEVDLTRAQLEYMIESKYPNDFLVKDHDEYGNLDNNVYYHPTLSRIRPDTDKTFRNGVVNAMTSIGINSHSIEVGLEQYSNLWRKETMQDAFYNRYDANEILNISKKHPNYDYEGVWFRLREYQYYQKHKAIIDELGLATPNMKINQLEAKRLDKDVALFEAHFPSAIKAEAKNIGNRNDYLLEMYV